MSGATLEVKTSPDGAIMIQPHGILDADDTVELSRTIVHALRRQHPPHLVVDLRDLADLDAVSLGILAAACHLGDEDHVAVFLNHSSPALAERLTAAGIPRDRLRHITSAA